MGLGLRIGVLNNMPKGSDVSPRTITLQVPRAVRIRAGSQLELDEQEKKFRMGDYHINVWGHVAYCPKDSGTERLSNNNKDSRVRASLA